MTRLIVVRVCLTVVLVFRVGPMTWKAMASVTEAKIRASLGVVAVMTAGVATALVIGRLRACAGWWGRGCGGRSWRCSLGLIG